LIRIYDRSEDRRFRFRAVILTIALRLLRSCLASVKP
jgi:hypothetical protein